MVLIIVTARSPVFSAMFEHEMEKCEKVNVKMLLIYIHV